MNKKVDPEKKVYAICGSVNELVKKELVREAEKQGVTIAKAVGALLTAWVQGKLVADAIVRAERDFEGRRRTV